MRLKAPCRYLQMCRIGIHTNLGRDIRYAIVTGSSERYKTESCAAREDGLR